MSLESPTRLEKSYMRWIKTLDCGVCDVSAPCDCHHITLMGRRISHFVTIPLCKDCHQGDGGIHGDKRLWKVLKLNEWLVLANVIKKLARKAGL